MPFGERWMRAVDKWIKLHMRKKAINFVVRVLNRLMPDVKATYPQTEMVERVFAKLNKVYGTEVRCGLFDDENFQRLLKLSEKLLVYFGEDDRYYRQWLGFTMLLVSDEVLSELSKLTFEDFITLTELQWEMNMSGAVPPEYFDAHKRDFLNIVLANYLTNLA